MVALTDSTGAVVNTYTYEPYGKIASSTGTTANPWRFGGSYGAYTENNNSGLLKIGERFYDPSLGRWTQQDPVLHLQNPKQSNRYIYAACNPVNAIDPTGTDCVSGFLGLGGAIAAISGGAAADNPFAVAGGVFAATSAIYNLATTCSVPAPDYSNADPFPPDNPAP